MPSHKPLKLASIKNLKYIWRKALDKKASGIDRISPQLFKENLDKNLSDIRSRLITGTYTFDKLRLASIPKTNGKHRIIAIPTVRDRLVQRLILNSLICPKDKLGVKM